MKKIKSIGKNFLSISAANILSQLMTFLVVAYYARILGVNKFGIISLAQSILTYFTMFTLFGFQTLGTKEVAKQDKSKETLCGNIIFIRFICAIVSFLILIAIGSLSNKGSEFRNVVILYGLTLFPLAFNIDWFYSGIKEMQYNGIYNILKTGIPFILTIALFKDASQMYFIPLFMVVGMILASAFHAYIFYKKENLKYKLDINKKKIRYLVIGSLPFVISALLSVINGNIDSIMIGFMRSDRELGLYSSSYKIVSFLINFIALIFTPFFPIIIELFNLGDKKQLEKIIDSLWKIIVMIACPLLIGGILLSKPIIILLFGIEFQDAYISFSLLLIYIFILFLRENYGYSLNAWNREKDYLIIVTISALINIILNAILIPMYGINAAAITTIISEIINFALMKKKAEEIIKVSYLKYFIKIVPSLIAMTAEVTLLKYLDANVLINIALAIIVYGVSLIGFKYLSKDEIYSILKRE